MFIALVWIRKPIVLLGQLTADIMNGRLLLVDQASVVCIDPFVRTEYCSSWQEYVCDPQPDPTAPVPRLTQPLSNKQVACFHSLPWMHFSYTSTTAVALDALVVGVQCSVQSG